MASGEVRNRRYLLNRIESEKLYAQHFYSVFTCLQDVFSIFQGCLVPPEAIR